ncbi:hypothetical protein [Siphonobacter sp. SORGH_AS_0500]|uniref:hypothetical protein n=1 Tax=Siphonobacter sp. SORGH_AS_0500 TaxID=1864824 RepID=UPI00285F63FB|nr:hypothetical protein [Siphonobacter sp. SORGH_AS_0500]MDR6195907.1 hypothetical protein [Siphonobacter sp. SORGH_AS_0500]
MSTKIELIIEKGEGQTLWGRVNYEDDLLTDEAESIQELEQKMRRLLEDFHKLSDVEFSYSYDLSAFFETHDYLKVSKIAELAGMNPSLLRHYAAGTKTASADQVKKIEDAVQAVANHLASISIIAA